MVFLYRSKHGYKLLDYFLPYAIFNLTRIFLVFRQKNVFGGTPSIL